MCEIRFYDTELASFSGLYVVEELQLIRPSIYLANHHLHKICRIIGVFYLVVAVSGDFDLEIWRKRWVYDGLLFCTEDCLHFPCVFQFSKEHEILHSSS